MRSFLSKFMDAAEIDKLEEAYKAKNPNVAALPIYIPKSRFDEKVGQLDEANDKIKRFETEKAAAIKAATKPLEEQLKAIPTDWQQQIDNMKQELATQKADYESKLAEAEKAADVTAKLYEAGARNIKAVRALIDDSKPIEEQITGLKASDPYLFTVSGIGKGTGKGDGAHGGDGDDGSGNDGNISTDAMYRAVGIAPPTK